MNFNKCHYPNKQKDAKQHLNILNVHHFDNSSIRKSDEGLRTDNLQILVGGLDDGLRDQLWDWLDHHLLHLSLGVQKVLELEEELEVFDVDLAANSLLIGGINFSLNDSRSLNDKLVDVLNPDLGVLHISIDAAIFLLTDLLVLNVHVFILFDVVSSRDVVVGLVDLVLLLQASQEQGSLHPQQLSLTPVAVAILLQFQGIHPQDVDLGTQSIQHFVEFFDLVDFQLGSWSFSNEILLQDLKEKNIC